MENIELQNIWKSYDRKLESMLAINKDIAVNLSRQKLNKQISRLYRPKLTAIIIGVAYTIFLIVIATITSLAKAYFMAIGFGAIALIMMVVILFYMYQLYLISKIKRDEEVLATQQLFAQLRISSFNGLKLSIFQLPFWSICWISINGLKDSPLVYGGVNLLIFLTLCYLSYWTYKKLGYKNEKSKVRDFFLSGGEWEPILKSEEILEQIKGYKK